MSTRLIGGLAAAVTGRTTVTPGASRPRPLSRKSDGEEPALGGGARRALEDERLSLEREPRLVPAELGAPLGDGERAGLALDRPGCP